MAVREDVFNKIVTVFKKHGAETIGKCFQPYLSVKLELNIEFNENTY
jgi:hypothetical protein